MTTIPVVIIDDDKVDRYIVQRIVQESDIEAKVIEYKAGDEFLEVLSDSKKRAAEIGTAPPPMLVLLDVNMPRMNGFEVLDSISRELGESDPDYMVVMMFTSSNHAEDKAKAFSYSFVKDYVVKPLTRERLQDVIAKHYS
ncbi:response regulator [Pelagibius litoralis]|uniref:Response regulator n=1 Tax=Pelagibius litoralis TaxID=374515 RepID=A0A967EV86_9PROT|nr:response regulator [Pelagibius litoralis]NIA67474.1 response regulator [Pelagibius litoralis]